MTDTTQQHHQQITDWLGDIIALESHVEEAMDHQLSIKSDNAELTATVKRFHDTVRDSKRRAEEYQKQHGAKASESAIKKGSELLGKAAGMIDKMRNDSVSKSLRDDFTAYNHLAISYTMLHTTAMALKDAATREFAAQGLRTYAGLVQDVNQVIPEAVVHDLSGSEDVPNVDTSIVAECRDFINQAWKTTNNT